MNKEKIKNIIQTYKIEILQILFVITTVIIALLQPAIFKIIILICIIVGIILISLVVIGSLVLGILILFEKIKRKKENK